MTHKQYINMKRVFYDSWALLLYLVSCVSCSFLVFYLTKENCKFFNFTDQEKRLFLQNLSVVISSLIFTVYSLRFYTYFFTKISFVFSIFVCLCLNIYCLNLSILLFSSIICIACICLFSLQKSLNRYLEIIKKIVKIILWRKLCFFIGSFFITMLICFQIFLFIHIHSKKFQYKQTFYVWIIFNFFWSVFNTFYMLKVLTTLIVAYHFINIEDKSAIIINDVVRGLYYASGSCSFGGLIVSLLHTIKYFVRLIPIKKSKKTQKISNLINLAIFYIFNYLQNVVQTSNAYTIPYLAIHGGGFIKSSQITYNLRNRDIFLNLRMKLLNLILTGLTLFVFVICILSTYNTLTSFELMSLKSKIVCMMPMILIIIFAIIISSSFLALMYLYDDRADLIKDNDIELYENLRHIKLESY